MNCTACPYFAKSAGSLVGGTVAVCFTVVEEHSKYSFCFGPTLTEDLWQALAESVCLLTSRSWICIQTDFFTLGRIETDFLELFWLSGLILLMLCKIQTLRLCFSCLSWVPLKCFIQPSVSQRSDVLDSCRGRTKVTPETLFSKWFK